MASTRAAVITTSPYQPHNYFDQQKDAKVFIIMKSDYGTDDYIGTKDSKYTVARADVDKNTAALKFDAVNQKYWDDAHGRSTKLNLWAYGQVGMNWTECSFGVDKSGGGYEKHAFQTANRFQWNVITNSDWTLSPIYPFIFDWKASHRTDDSQDEETVMCQDLFFSNNLVDNSATGTNLGGVDNSLKFDFTTRKFPKEGEAVMKFYRAMSKITIKIVEDAGFDKSATTDFQFKPGTNVKLTDFNTKGLFSIQQGQFQEIHQYNPIPSIYLKSTTPTEAVYYTLEALAIPNVHSFLSANGGEDTYSRFVKDANNVMMSFTIDNSDYKVTSAQLYNALHVDADPSKALVSNATEKTDNGTYIPLEAGKHYIFTFRVGKKAINNITAQVAQWEDVTAAVDEITNASISIDIEDDRTEDTQNSPYAFYRLEDNVDEIPANPDAVARYNWTSGYTEDVDHRCLLSYNSGWKLTNSEGEAVNWYWPNSLTYYHFRVIQPADAAIVDKKEYNISSTSDASYDPRWGAPFKEINQSAKDILVYDKEDKKGFDVNRNDAVAGITDNPHQIYKAIGATTGKITLIPIHMMSRVTFTITTTDNDGFVDLGNGTDKKTKVELLAYHTDAKVQIGNGYVDAYTPSTANKSEIVTEIPLNKFEGTASGKDAKASFYYAVVPQDLSDVELRITTPDQNRYIVPLKDIRASHVSENEIKNPYTKLADGGYKIDYWYPNYRYEYTLQLTKKGISDLKATIVDWEYVTAGLDNIQIE